MQKPDWSFWRAMPEVELWQAVALSLGIDPDAIGGDNPSFDKLRWCGDTRLSAETVEQFSKRLRLLYGNLVRKGSFSRFIIDYEDRHLSKIRLSDFATWAASVAKWASLPPELVAMAQNHDKREAAPAESKGQTALIATMVEGPTILGDEPRLQQGKNSREKVGAWVKWQAKQESKAGDTGDKLAERIRLKANRWGYQSARTKDNETISAATIIKMLPSGITGGRGKTKSKSKK